MFSKRKKTPEMSLFDIFQSLEIEQYKKTVLQERYLEVLHNFHRRSITLAYMFYITRIIMTVGSILVPAFLSIQGSTFQLQIYWATWVLSLSVTISNGFMTLFKIDKKYFFINTTLELLHSEGWQYVGLSGRYAGKDGVAPTHENQFLVFFHMAEKIKMRQVEEEYWKFTDTSGVGNATNAKSPLITPTPVTQQGAIRALPEEQKDVIERWVGDMKSNMLGLQPRVKNIAGKLDERTTSSGISKSSSNSEMPVRPSLQSDSIAKESLVRISQATNTSESDAESEGNSSISTEIPENTIIKIVHEESDVWSGANTRS
jgi:hypothetical protein